MEDSVAGLYVLPTFFELHPVEPFVSRDVETIQDGNASGSAAWKRQMKGNELNQMKYEGSLFMLQKLWTTCLVLTPRLKNNTQQQQLQQQQSKLYNILRRSEHRSKIRVILSNFCKLYTKLNQYIMYNRLSITWSCKACLAHHQSTPWGSDAVQRHRWSELCSSICGRAAQEALSPTRPLSAQSEGKREGWTVSCSWHDPSLTNVSAWSCWKALSKSFNLRPRRTL